jgi:alpha/beta superfamily hydrolase
VTAQHRGTFGARPQDLAPAHDDVTDNARAMVQAGYDVLLFDFRGCGQSDGEHQTLGTLEPRDVLGAHDYMVGRGYAASRMTFLGISDGATALLRAAPGMPDVAAIVSDSAYNRLAPQLDAFWSGAGVPARLRWLATQITRVHGVDPFASTADSVRAAPSRAVLFIHARGDAAIPYTDALALRAASASGQSQLWITDGRMHMATYSAYPQEYLHRLHAFIDARIGDVRQGGTA